MALNETFRNAARLSLPVAEGTKSGDPVIVGDLPGIAITDRGKGGNPDGNATVCLEGAFEVTVAAATTVGGPVYITSAGVLNGTAASNKLWGYALAAQAASGVVPVKIARV